MKRSAIVTFFLLLVISGNIFSQNLKKGLRQITPELLEQHIGFLASDSLKGRNTPSPGLDLAADYIAGQFASTGIQKINGSWFQNIPLITKNLDIDKCLFRLTKGEVTKTFSLKTDYIPFEMTADTMVKSSMVFAGYGITAPEFNYDDYMGMDVRGKIVLVMKHEPGEKDSTSLFNGKIDTKHSLINTKVENAMNHGAIGLLVITDPLNHMLITPQGYPWPGLSKFLPQDNLPVELLTKEDQIPVVQIGDAVVKFLFGSLDSLKNIQKRIDKSYTPSSFQLVHSECDLSTRLKITGYSAKNVIGLLEGRDAELKKEYVVIGGHYDHVGFMKKHKDGEDYIYNGADDNASGTAGVLAIAKAYASMKTKPERSVVFILFAGEELGLFGSKYYCENPLVPVEKTVAMLNLDMISRNGHDTLQYKDLKDKVRNKLANTGKSLSSEKVDSSDVAAVVSQLDLGKLKFLPGKPVKFGEKWQNISVEKKKASSGNPFAIEISNDTEYTLNGKETVGGKEYLKVSFSGNMTITGKGTQMGMEMFIEGTGKNEGFSYFDTKTCMIVSSDENTEMNMNIAVSGPQNMTIPMTQSIKTVTTFEEKK